MITASSERLPRILVELPRALAVELAVLSEAPSDPEVDLQEQVHRLGAVLAVSMSSFLGLRVTVVVDGYPFTITVMDEGGVGAAPVVVGASVLITLGSSARTGASGTVVFYASAPGAFVDLAADATRRHPSPGAVVLDAHLDDPEGDHPVSGSSGWSEASMINQALGVVMGGGRTLEEARLALDARAVGTVGGLVATARAVIAAAAARHPNHDGGPWG